MNRSMFNCKCVDIQNSVFDMLSLNRRRHYVSRTRKYNNFQQNSPSNSVDYSKYPLLSVLCVSVWCRSVYRTFSRTHCPISMWLECLLILSSSCAEDKIFPTASALAPIKFNKKNDIWSLFTKFCFSVARICKWKQGKSARTIVHAHMMDLFAREEMSLKRGYPTNQYVYCCFALPE